MTSSKASFTFAHLSDIHFAGYRDGAIFDLESNIRTELVYDLRKIVTSSGPLDAILIGGDIAGKGQKEEYEKAAKWIDELCEEFGVPPEMVFCVPGNHDVYRLAIESDPLLRTAQETLLDCPLEQLIPRLEELFTSEKYPALMLSGLANYNFFASGYSSAMLPEDHRWTWTEEFGDLKIHIVGLASAILCGPKDVKASGDSKLAIGPQARFHRFDDDTVVILLCHHPPSWLRDYDQHKTFMERAHLQLYGHEHSFDVLPSGAGLRIDAGAVQPPRSEEDCRPSYNVISLYRDPGDSSKLTVDIYARRLGDDEVFTEVEPGETPRRETISLTGGSVVFDDGSGGGAAALTAPPEPSVPSPEPDPIEERQLAHRFVSLDRDSRLRIGQEMELIGAAEEALDEGARLRHVFERARQEGRLEELAEKMND